MYQWEFGGVYVPLYEIYPHTRRDRVWELLVHRRFRSLLLCSVLINSFCLMTVHTWGRILVLWIWQPPSIEQKLLRDYAAEKCLGLWLLAKMLAPSAPKSITISVNKLFFFNWLSFQPVFVCLYVCRRAKQVEFIDQRNWDQFHSPRNVLLAMVGEVGELAEIL